MNEGTDIDPVFDAGSFLEAGPPGAGTVINVGRRATSTVVDWNNDGRKDLAVGALDGRLSIFLGEEEGSVSYLASPILAESNGVPLVVPGSRSSPVVVDMDGDGKKDLLTGETYGKLLFYSNVGTDESPMFAGYSLALSEGQVIDLTASRSRPFVCDWTGDGYLDVLVGASDGRVDLYQGIPEPATLLLLGFGALLLRRKR